MTFLSLYEFLQQWNTTSVIRLKVLCSAPAVRTGKGDCTIREGQRLLGKRKRRRERCNVRDDVVPVTGLEPVRCRQRWILSYSSHSEPNGLNRNKTVFSVTFQNIKNPKKPYKISIFDAKHQKYKQFVPSSIIGSQIPNLRRWRDVGGM